MHLVGLGHQVINPKLDDNDFAVALLTAQTEFVQHQPDVVVGSSRGGAVAMNIVTGDTPLVLLCPAWKRWGSVRFLKANALILHSRNDDVVPFEDSEQLVASSGLPPESLIEVGHDHRLADDESLSALSWACRLPELYEQLPGSGEVMQRPGISSASTEAAMPEEGVYVCDACGEEIVIPLDLTEGFSQTYVEDCPVCCRANTIHVRIDENGDVRVRAEPEQDYE